MKNYFLKSILGFFLFSLSFSTFAQSDISLLQGVWELDEVEFIDQKQGNIENKKTLRKNVDDLTSIDGVIKEVGFFDEDFFLSKTNCGYKGKKITLEKGVLTFFLSDSMVFTAQCSLLKDGRLQLSYEEDIVKDGTLEVRKYICVYSKR